MYTQESNWNETRKYIFRIIEKKERREERDAIFVVTDVDPIKNIKK